MSSFNPPPEWPSGSAPFININPFLPSPGLGLSVPPAPNQPIQHNAVPLHHYQHPLHVASTPQHPPPPPQSDPTSTNQTDFGDKWAPIAPRFTNVHLGPGTVGYMNMPYRPAGPNTTTAQPTQQADVFATVPYLQSTIQQLPYIGNQQAGPSTFHTGPPPHAHYPTLVNPPRPWVPPSHNHRPHPYQQGNSPFSAAPVAYQRSISYAAPSSHPLESGHTWPQNSVNNTFPSASGLHANYPLTAPGYQQNPAATLPYSVPLASGSRSLNTSRMGTAPMHGANSVDSVTEEGSRPMNRVRSDGTEKPKRITYVPEDQDVILEFMDRVQWSPTREQMLELSELCPSKPTYEQLRSKRQNLIAELKKQGKWISVARRKSIANGQIPQLSRALPRIDTGFGGTSPISGAGGRRSSAYSVRFGKRPQRADAIPSTVRAMTPRSRSILSSRASVCSPVSSRERSDPLLPAVHRSGASIAHDEQKSLLRVMTLHDQVDALDISEPSVPTIIPEGPVPRPDFSFGSVSVGQQSSSSPEVAAPAQIASNAEAPDDNPFNTMSMTEEEAEAEISKFVNWDPTDWFDVNGNYVGPSGDNAIDEI